MDARCKKTYNYGEILDLGEDRWRRRVRVCELGVERCLNFYKYIWFEVGNIMWKKHRSVLQDHAKYIKNIIVKPFRVGIFQYAESFRDIHNL